MSKKKHTLLSLKQAQHLALKSQGLDGPAFGKGKKAVLAAIEHLGYVQIDTLAVVARAHHHTLWTRVSDYKESYLHELHETDKQVFEYWSHAASYLPIKDYRYSLFTKKTYADGKSHWFSQDKKLKKYVLERIKSEGALQSKDFEYKRNGPGNWYAWKPAKQALEQLFMEGKLMVAKRQGFQKVYDLPENVLASTVDLSIPSEAEYAEYLVHSSIRANGIVEEKEIAYIRSGLKEAVSKALKKLIKNGSLLEVQIEGMGELLFVTSPEQLAATAVSVNQELQLLSPFDNAIIQRKRIKRLFDFDYQIECYVPEAKRTYGYFCLPVLLNGSFVARFDPKADRAAQTFYVKSMYFEKGFKPDEAFNRRFAAKLKEFAAFNGCNKIVIDQADKTWKRQMKVLL